ncbi:MAG: tetratricopeptide repeat protein [Brevinematia bacterium]
MGTYDRQFNLDFFDKLLEIGKEKEALKLIYDLFQDRREDGGKIKKMLSSLSAVYVERREYKKALVILKEAAFLDPEDEALRFNLGLVYFFYEDYTKAIHIFENLDRDKFSKKFLPYLTFCYLATGKDEKAINLIKDKDFLSSRDDEIYMVGMKFIEKKHFEVAKDIFEEMVKKGSKNKSTIYGLGISYFSCGDFEKAKECFESISKEIEKDSKDFDYFYIGLGVSCYQVGDYDGAIKAFSKAIEKKIYMDVALLYTGKAYLKQNKLQAAIDSIREAKKLNPREPEIWKTLGDIYYENGDIENARLNYDKCFKITNDINFAFRLGLIEVLEKNFNKAYPYFKQCLESERLDPSQRIEVLKQLVLCAYYIERYEEALVYSRELMEKGIREERFFLIISYSLIKLNILDEAEEILNLALEIFPESAALLYTLGTVKSTQFKYEEADALFEKAIKIEKNPDFLYAAGLTKMKLNDKLSAIRLFSELENYYENDSKLLYKLALFYIELGEEGKAKNLFEKILALEPENTKVREKLKKLNV